MADITFEELVEAAQKLTPDLQKALIEAIQPHSVREETFREAFGLQVFDVGPWPDELTLRREDDDNER